MNGYPLNSNGRIRYEAVELRTKYIERITMSDEDHILRTNVLIGWRRFQFVAVILVLSIVSRKLFLAHGISSNKCFCARSAAPVK